MSGIVPTIGRIVIYKVSDEDVKTIHERRTEGTQASTALSNHVHLGDEFPAMVVRTWGDRFDSAVNLKVMLDGADTYWATSRVVGDNPGNYHWMEYQRGQAAKYDQLEKEKSQVPPARDADRKYDEDPVDAKKSALFGNKTADPALYKK